MDVRVSVTDTAGLTSAAHLAVVVGSTFEESAASLGMGGFADDAGRGVCAGDVDNDGDVDVFLAVDSLANQLWVNDGSGTFTNVAAAWGVEDVSLFSYGCGFGDADGDLVWPTNRSKSPSPSTSPQLTVRLLSPTATPRATASSVNPVPPAFMCRLFTSDA